MEKKNSYRIDEVAEDIDVSPRTIERFIKSGILKAIKKGASRRITDEEWTDFIKKNTTRAKFDPSPIAKNTPVKTKDFLFEQLGNPGLIMSGEEFLRFKKPTVYAWIRGSEVLYVGKSIAGICRPLGNHHVLNIFNVTDNLFLWHFKTDKEASAKEREIILAVKPIYNNIHI